MWKDLSLTMKIGAGIGCVIFLLCIVSSLSYFGVGGIVQDAGIVIEGNKLRTNLGAKEVDHLNWANKVIDLLTDPKVNELKVQFDDHKCGFGKWLYGEERKRAEHLVPELAPLFKKIEAPHKHLHESALHISKTYKAADPDLPALFLEKEIDHLNWAGAIRDSLINNDKSLHVKMDSKKCSLGKWIDTEKAKQVYKTGDDNFKHHWDSMVADHTKLHETAKHVNQALSVSHEDAVTVFKSQTLPLLESTIENLLKLKDNAERRLDGIYEARHIFSIKTKPALQEVQTLIGEMSETSKKHIMTDKQMLKRAGTTKTQVLVFSVIAIIIGVFLAIFIARAISSPMIKSVAFVKTVGDGDLTHQLDIDQKDEVGALAQSMNDMSKNLHKIFGDIINGIATLTSSSTELSAASSQITSNSETTAEKSNSVSAAAEEMSTNMNSVAAATEQATANIQMIVAGTEEMTATIQEIAGNMARGGETTSHAVEKAQEVSLKVDELGKAASEINKVTETIADISEQTNLLALNATIEAARAGEAGKGFSVVAGEIKALAQQTAEATTQISEKISSVQTTTDESVSAIEAIVKVINDINEIVTTVAAAIEEQSATTQEISTNVSQAALGIQEVNENVNQASAVTGEVTRDITEVNQAAQETNTGSRQVNETATELSKLAENLNTMASQFKI